MIRLTFSVVQLEDRTNPANLKLGLDVATSLVVPGPVVTSPPVSPPPSSGGTVISTPPPPTSPPVTGG